MEAELVQVTLSLADLGRSSRWSVPLVLCGVLFLARTAWYGGRKINEAVLLQSEIEAKKVQTHTLESEINSRKADLAQLQTRYKSLQAGIESFPSLQVTPSNTVYEVKAMARATGKLDPRKKPLYDFSVYINAPDAVLQSISRVKYHFDHSIAPHKVRVVDNRERQLMTAYTGFSCSKNVGVDAHLEDGSTRHLDFDMCKSLGPEW